MAAIYENISTIFFLSTPDPASLVDIFNTLKGEVLQLAKFA